MVGRKDNLYIGGKIKELRKKRSMTGVELAERSNLSQSKISKIETGRYPRLNDAEIEKILNILDAPHTIRQQIFSLLDNGSMRQDVWTVQAAFQDESQDLEKKSKLVNLYVSNAIPALLQTVEYRAAYLRRGKAAPESIDGNLKRTLQRQDELWSKDHTFHIIMHQTALYTIVTDAQTHRAQLDRVERMIGLPRTRIGIIPVEAGLLPVEHSSFAIYDAHTLIQAVGKGEITTHDEEELELHLNAFTALERLACYGDDAIALVRKAHDYFS